MWSLCNSEDQIVWAYFVCCFAVTWGVVEGTGGDKNMHLLWNLELFLPKWVDWTWIHYHVTLNFRIIYEYIYIFPRLKLAGNNQEITSEVWEMYSRPQIVEMIEMNEAEGRVVLILENASSKGRIKILFWMWS